MAMAQQFRASPCAAMKPTDTLPVEYTTMFGPPAIGSMKANDEARHTIRSSCTGSYPLAAAVVATMEPKIESVAMFETTSVMKVIASVTTRMKPNSPVPASASLSAIHEAKPDTTVPWAIKDPPPNTKRISHWNLPLTLSQSRMHCGDSPAAAELQRSSPSSRRRNAGRRAPQGTKKRGMVMARPMAPEFSSGATCTFQPEKLPIGEAENQNTISASRSSATTICSKLTLPSFAYISWKTVMSIGTFSSARQT
mmetsp:Transcript_76712/g.197588  ORF Transcript_76712/g.197588 Transcript_76712/m.197588 type:complete len:253 (-) Transcript_76712:360-1118(-)